MQNLLLETMAGKQRANILASILSDPQYLKDVFESSSTKYQGSAQQELDKYLDSITAKMQKFTNEVHSFWTGLIDSDAVKFFVDLGSQLLKTVNTIGQVRTAIVALAGVLGAKKLGMFSTVFVDGTKKVTIFGKTLDQLKQRFKDGGFKNLFDFGLKRMNLSELENIRTQVEKLMTTEGLTFNQAWIKMGDQVSGVNDRVKSLMVTENGTIRTTDELATQFKNVGKSGINFTNILKTGLSFVGNVALTAAISFLASKGMELFNNWINSAKLTKEAVNDLMNEFETSSKTIDDHKKNVDEILKEYDGLSKCVDRLGNNVSLTTEEYAKYQSYNKQIAEMFPDMISGYNDTGDAIINVANATEELNKQLEKEQDNLDKKLIAGTNKALKNFKQNVNDEDLVIIDIQQQIVDAILKNDTADKIQSALERLFDSVDPDLKDSLVNSLGSWYNISPGNFATGLGGYWFDDSGELLGVAERKSLLQKFIAETQEVSDEINKNGKAVIQVGLAAFRNAIYNDEEGLYTDLANNSQIKQIGSLIISNWNNAMLDSFSEMDESEFAIYISTFVQNLEDAAKDKNTAKEISDAYNILFGNALKDASGNIASEISPVEYAKIINNTIDDVIASLNLDPDVFTNIFKSILNMEEIESESQKYNSYISNIMMRFGNRYTTPVIESYIKDNKINSVSAIADFWDSLTTAYNNGATSWDQAVAVWENTVKERFTDTTPLLPFDQLFSAD